MVVYIYYREPLIGKLVWSTAIVFGFIFATLAIRETLLDWEEHPVLISIESTDYPSNQVQFPTITICPGIQMFLHL